ncbi:hypothetical protein OH76DRAFT_630647 [Lentinus brumalis]|uniref:Uncharacterized protein n=1 Tax=Lentinus brumalis TaxID=2498619 RepID=A0A371D8G0_9APHY|nr:hypothetical protein OH76DRAFT_630647 [Polyporus brumalis]
MSSTQRPLVRMQKPARTAARVRAACEGGVEDGITTLTSRIGGQSSDAATCAQRQARAPGYSASLSGHPAGKSSHCSLLGSG